MTYASNPYYANYSCQIPHPGVPPLHMPQYIHQQQQMMPQADLSKVFAGGQAPQFIPPQELLQSSYAYSQVQLTLRMVFMKLSRMYYLTSPL